MLTKNLLKRFTPCDAEPKTLIPPTYHDWNQLKKEIKKENDRPIFICWIEKTSLNASLQVSRNQKRLAGKGKKSTAGQN